MAFPTTGLLDNFNRADENPLSNGGAWTSPWRNANAMKVQTNQAVGSSAVGFNDAYLTNATYGPDCEVYATLATAQTGTEAIYLALRIQDVGGQDWYLLYITKAAGADTWQIYRGDNGVNTALGSSFTQEVSSGDTIGFEAISTTLTAYYKASGGSWVSLASRTDATYGSAGNLGFGQENQTARWDDFSGGTSVGLTTEYVAAVQSAHAMIGRQTL